MPSATPIPQYIEWPAGADLVINQTLVPVPVGGIGGWGISFYFLNALDVMLFNLSVGSGVAIVSPSLAQIQYTLRRGATVGYAYGEYKFTSWRTDSGFDTELAKGTINLSQPRPIPPP
jgi:hypothetical protein